jgi:hypothetical protein
MPKFLPRISLLTALLLMTIIGMTIVLAQLWRSVEPLRTENRRFRKELGYLSVIDENKIYATEIASDDPDSHRYRVYIPKTGSFMLHSRVHTIPGQLPTQTKPDWIANLLQSRSGTSSSLEPGEYTFDVKLRRKPEEKDRWDFIVNRQGRGAGSVGSTMPWLNDRRAWFHSSDVPSTDHIEADPNVGVVLYMLRQGIVTESNNGYSTSSPDYAKDTPGLMLWIAPATPGN